MADTFIYCYVSKVSMNVNIIINTDKGLIVGEYNGNHRRWAGIPYARAPVDELRWMPPQPVKGWDGVRETTRFGAACWQITGKQPPESAIVRSMMSEDCLTLNIWAPEDNQEPLPVMVWFHGGAFRLGASWLPPYDGSRLAEQGVIVVSVNYRLGPLAVFPHRALAANSSTPMNFGLLDQIAALQWIQRNIVRFGGDAQNVTIWGESAGGASVGYLLQSPLARGLFHKAIMQSGALDLSEFSREEALIRAEKVLPDDIKSMCASELRQLSPEVLLALPLERTQTMPIIDGVTLMATTPEALATGKIIGVPLLIGSNNYEAGFFPPAWVASLPGKMGVNWLAANTLTDGYGKGTQELKAAQLATDKFATLPTRQFADAMAKQGTPVWRYYFSWVTPPQRATVPGAIHTAEIPYIFGNLDGFCDYDSQDRQLSESLMARWLQFARNGNPNVKGEAIWPAWQQGSANLFSISNDGQFTISEPGASRLDFLEMHNNFTLN
ncbi:carboxylesterase/lipase family protein [Klebsiella pneumoniae]|uniref:carboxylesterase/lipase family protein n=1 Tax=Klebsiella pneumoniae TaxID=573 RepID=UPI0007D6CBA7|nr:carboxylesterase family protein [Klebsiella pneumoniae]